MRSIKYFFCFVILSFLFFFVPTNSISKPLLYGESTDEGSSPVFDPVCMVTVLEMVSYCPMYKQDSTGSVCTCHNQLRTFSGFVVKRQEYTALCRSWPQGSCSNLDPETEPEFLNVQNEPVEPQSDNSSPSDAFAGETTSTEDEPSVLQSENSTELQEDSAEQIASTHSPSVAPQNSVPLSPSEPDQVKDELSASLPENSPPSANATESPDDSAEQIASTHSPLAAPQNSVSLSPSEPDQTKDALSASLPDNSTPSESSTESPDDSAEQIASGHFAMGATPAPIPSSPLEPGHEEIDFEEILNRHPLRKFKKPSLLEILSGEQKLN